MQISAALSALLSSRQVRTAMLVHLDFKSGPMRVWTGFGSIETGGYTWSGLGELGKVGAIEIPANGNAPTVTFTLSGVAPGMIAKALSARDETYDRDVVVYLQHFDETWAPVDGPIPLYFGRMDVMKARATSQTTRVVEVTAEWLFSRRTIPAFAYLSDRDQKARVPGDLGAAFVSSMQSKTVIFPR